MYRTRDTAFLYLVLQLAACGGNAAGTPPAPPPPAVSVITVQHETLALTEELPGRVVAFRVAEVRPQVSGIVRRRTFTEGQIVRAGQPLYQIDGAPFRAEVAGTSATLDRTDAALAQATLQAERTARLLESGAASQQAHDDAQAVLALATAERGQARAALQRSRLSLRFATITAPIEGQIGISRITEGALVSPADPLALATIQQIDQVYVDIKEPAERASALRNALTGGNPAAEGATEVIILASDGTPYPMRGRVLFSDITVDPGTGELTLRALVPNTDRHLLPGMFVRAQLARGTRTDAILVPQQAVQREPTGGAQVLVVGTDQKVVVRPVTTDRVVDGRYLVTRGLSPGDRVIVEGYDRVRPGMPVNPSAWTPPPASAQH